MTTEKSKIVRRPDRAAGGITPQEKALMEEHARKWIANAMRTDTVDRAETIAAIKQLYAVAELPEPRVVIVPSPRVMAFAGGLASAWWYLREHGGAPATDAAAEEATDDATYAATAVATEAATDAATLGATDDATRDATHAATDHATDDVTDAAARDATDAATDHATNDVTRDATESLTLRTLAVDLLGEQYAQLGIKCVAMWRRCRQGGNMWSHWDCYLTAARDILGLRLEPHAKYAAWERCARAGGFRWMHEKFCIVSDFPEVLTVDNQHRPHCATGPSHRWRDGWELYYWHGVRVTRQIVMAPQTLTIEQVRAEKNTEVRRVMIERMGYERYVRESGAQMVHEDRYGKLWRAPREGDTDVVMVEVMNSTPEPDGSRNRYMLRVPPDTRTAHDAVAWTFGRAARTYEPEIET